MAVVTWDGSSSTDFATAANWTTGSVPTSSDDVIIPDTSSINDCVLDGDRTINSLQIQGNGSFSMNDHDLTIAGENSSGRALDIGNSTVTFVGGTGTLIFTQGSGSTKLVGTQHIVASTELRNVQFNGAATFVMNGAMTVNGNLTISAGTLSTSSDNNYALTVTSDISNSGTLQGNASAISSRKLTSTGTLNGGNFTVTGAGLSATTRTTDLGGTVSGNVDITLTGAGSNRHEDLQASGNIRNLTINNAAAVVHTGRNTTIDGDLTITAGTLSTDDSGTSVDLTVAGHVSVDGTLTGNTSAISVGSMIINSGGTYSATSGTTTVTSENASHAFRCSGGGTYTNNDGTLLITTAAQTRLKMNGTGNVHHLTVNHASCQLHMESDSSTTVEGDLTITAGTVNTNTEGGASRNLTVAGELKIDGGTLTCNASDVIVRNIWGASGTLSAPSNSSTNGLEITGKQPSGGLDNSNYSMYFVGTTLTNNDGLIVLSADENTFIRMPQTLGNFKIRNDGSSSTRTHEFTMNFACDHDLTLENGTFQSYGTTQTLTIGDDVLITKGTLGRTSNTAAYSFGSLEIASEGTFIATSGTTTITNKNSSNYMFFDAGTFTHNNGTVHFKADTSSGTWYAVKGHSTEDTTEFYNVTTERVGSSVGNYRVCVGGSNQFFTVRNNLTVAANCKIFSSNGSSILRHSGLAILDGELDLDSFTDIEMGAVTINSGGILEFDNGSITIKAESLRNVGGTINA